MPRTSRFTPPSRPNLREHQPKLLAIWGRNNPFYLPPGAEAFRRALPEAEVHLIDTMHFDLETHAAKIAQEIGTFLQ